MFGSKLFGILDLVSRPDRGRCSGSNRKPRLEALEFAAKLSSRFLVAVTGFGFVVIAALIFVPPPFWHELDITLRDVYWRLFTEKVKQFELALQANDQTQIQATSRMFFGLTGDLRPRDYGESYFIHALESALFSTDAEVRLSAAEAGSSLRPNDSLFLYHLGIERLRAGETGAGIEALKRSFQLRPHSRQAASALIRALEQTQDNSAILRVRSEYTSGVSSVVGKMTPLHVIYNRSDGAIVGELQRFDACRPIDLPLRGGPNLRLNAVYFPQVDRLRVSVDAVTTEAIERLQNFRTAPGGGLISEIAVGDAFMTTPGIIFKGNPQAFSLQMEFCADGGSGP